MNITASTLLDAFELGNEYTYSIKNLIRVDEIKADSNRFEYLISGQLKVGSVWGNSEEKILKFMVNKRFHNISLE